MTEKRTGHSTWMCPSHLAVIHRDKSAVALPNEIQTPDTKKTAVHESAHVVVARLLGFLVESVRIVEDPNDHTPGAAKITWGEPPSDARLRQKWAGDVARVCFAGLYAMAGDAPEGSREWAYAEDAAVEDTAFAMHTLIKNVDGCRLRRRFYRLVQEARDDAAELIRQTVDVRGCLVEELLRTGGLPLDRINAVVDPLLPPRDPSCSR